MDNNPAHNLGIQESRACGPGFFVQTARVTFSRAQVSQLLDDFDVSPSRALGQNFVADPNTVRKIVRLACVDAETKVVEIGAGLGCLTLGLAETGAPVTAVEIDKHVLPALRETMSACSNVEVVEGDAMKLDWDAVLPPDNGPYVLVANLPYNIATPLVADILDEVPQIQRMLIMVQREAGERFAAPIGTKDFGAVTLKVSYWAKAKVLANVPRTIFVPRPNVDSVLVEIVRRDEVAVDVDRQELFALIRAGFAQRRKMLRRSLAGLVDENRFAVAGVDSTARAETLGLEDWARLVRAQS